MPQCDNATMPQCHNATMPQWASAPRYDSRQEVAVAGTACVVPWSLGISRSICCGSDDSRRRVSAFGRLLSVGLDRLLRTGTGPSRSGGEIGSATMRQCDNATMRQCHNATMPQCHNATMPQWASTPRYDSRQEVAVAGTACVVPWSLGISRSICCGSDDSRRRVSAFGFIARPFPEGGSR